MTTTTEPSMGPCSVELELANDADLMRAETGIITPDKVRRVKIRGVVDSGATRLVIPESVAKALGLEVTGKMTVRYADGRKAERPVVGRCQLSYIGRQSIFNAIVEPDRDSALIGAIVMEDLDLLIDCVTGRLVPRDPNGIISEVE